MNSALSSLTVSSTFLGIHSPLWIKDQLILLLTKHTYLPKKKDPREDRLAVAAVPAFQLLQEKIHSFAVVGTGAGLDALAAIDICKPDIIIMTDIHQDVVDAAYQNVLSNITSECKATVRGSVGNLGDPLIASGIKYDVVYENLPNIPLPEEKKIDESINSSSFMSPLSTASLLAKQYLLELHEQLLLQSKDFLTDGGKVLSCIGARMPLSKMLAMTKIPDVSQAYFFIPRKIQTEAEDVISGYAQHEALGKGPFYFYPLDAIKAIFAPYSLPEEAATHAFEIEQMLEPYRISSNEAVQLGETMNDLKLCHTVAIIASSPLR